MSDLIITIPTATLPLPSCYAHKYSTLLENWKSFAVVINHLCLLEVSALLILVVFAIKQSIGKLIIFESKYENCF